MSRYIIIIIYEVPTEFSLKTADLAARLLLSCAHDLPPGGRIWLLFYRKFINCLLKHCEIWKKGQFKH